MHIESDESVGEMTLFTILMVHGPSRPASSLVHELHRCADKSVGRSSRDNEKDHDEQAPNDELKSNIANIALATDTRSSCSERTAIIGQFLAKEFLKALMRERKLIN